MIFNSYDNSVCYVGTAMILEIDNFDTITYANRTFLDVSGYTREELIGLSHKALRHPDLPQSIYTKMWESINNTLPWQGYLKYRYKESQSCWVAVHISPVSNNGKAPIRHLLSLTAPHVQTIQEIQKNYRKLLEEEQKLLFKAEIANRLSIQSFQNTPLAL
ncbi:PAS domain-containing protein [Sulfuricurvum sp.]|uniref:PAS domain-containing protein n=1 Tax=Sulfuricurvum sp. TaxID=2025608 RepID=UPI002633E7F3|nr:PAS domain-containing protein [Sulfuricurvum sp.]MDD2781704.1 PAS domain-containing protein [Sulfuricurvum sp.]